MKTENPLRMLFINGIRWIALKDVETLFEKLSLEETNPKVRTRLFEILDNIRRM